MLYARTDLQKFNMSFNPFSRGSKGTHPAARSHQDLTLRSYNAAPSRERDERSGGNPPLLPEESRLLIMIKSSCNHLFENLSVYHQNVVGDIRNSSAIINRARQICALQVPLLWALTLVVLLVVTGRASVSGKFEPCGPDGQVYIGYKRFRNWYLSGFFQITLGFGQLPFGVVKFIDVAWDVRMFLHVATVIELTGSFRSLLDVWVKFYFHGSRSKCGQGLLLKSWKATQSHLTCSRR